MGIPARSPPQITIQEGVSSWAYQLKESLLTTMILIPFIPVLRSSKLFLQKMLFHLNKSKITNKFSQKSNKIIFKHNDFYLS